MDAREQRTMLSARSTPVARLKDIENSARGLLRRGFGLRLPLLMRVRSDAGVRDPVAGSSCSSAGDIGCQPTMQTDESNGRSPRVGTPTRIRQCIPGARRDSAYASGGRAILDPGKAGSGPPVRSEFLPNE